MESTKQTAGEGERDTSETSQVLGEGFEVRFISTSAVAVSDFLRLHLCVVLHCVYLYNWVMLWNTWLPPTTAGVKTEHFSVSKAEKTHRLLILLLFLSPQSSRM